MIKCFFFFSFSHAAQHGCYETHQNNVIMWVYYLLTANVWVLLLCVHLLYIRYSWSLLRFIYGRFSLLVEHISCGLDRHIVSYFGLGLFFLMLSLGEMFLVNVPPLLLCHVWFYKVCWSKLYSFSWGRKSTAQLMRSLPKCWPRTSRFGVLPALFCFPRRCCPMN